MKKILLIVGIVIAAIVLAVSLLISPIVKRYVEKNSVELIGRQVTMNKLFINVFTGGVSIKGFTLAAQPQSNDMAFVKLDTLETKIRILPMISSKFIIQKLHLSGLKVDVWQNGDKFNFDDILAHFPADTTTKTDETNSSWSIGIYDIQINKSRVDYKDIAIGSAFNMDDISLNIPGIYFSDQSTDVGLFLKFVDGGELATSMSYDINSAEYKLNLKFKDFDVSGILPYVRQQFNIGSLGGLLTSDVNVVGDMDHIMDFSLDGRVGLKNVFANADDKSKLLAVNSMWAAIKEVNLSDERYILDSLVVDGASTLFEMNAGGQTNFTSVFKAIEQTAATTANATTSSTTTPTAQMQFQIGVLDINDASVEIKDNVVPNGFVYNITDIDMDAANFALDQKNSVKVSAVMNGAGKALLNWKGNMSDINNQNITIKLSNVNLKPLTPYMLQYFAYPLRLGTLSFTSQNIIAGGMLNGTNHLEAYKVEVGKRVKTIKPEYKIPFKTVLYVLKDKNDRIDMTLPVKGNINSPEFSYRKIIIKTILNLMTKVATAPLSFMANALGINADNLQELTFSASQRDFTLEQYSKLGNVVTILKGRDELEVAFDQHVNYQAAIQSLALRELKKNFYLRNNPAKVDALELIDYKAISEIDHKNQELIIYADSLLATPDNRTAIAEKAMTLYQAKAESMLTSSLDRLDAALRQYLVAEGVTDTRVMIKRQTLEQMKAYTGQTMYKINVALKGESAMEPEAEAASASASETSSGIPSEAIPNPDTTNTTTTENN